MIKIIAASFLGTMFEIAGLLLGDYNIFLVIVHLFEILFMVWFVLGKERQKMIKVILTGYFFVMFINGLLEIFWNWFGKYGNYLFYLLIACGITYVVVRIWLNYSRIKKGVFAIKMIHGGKIVHIHGLYDSGNKLKDPYCGKGIHIISKTILEKLAIPVEKRVCVPYQSLGNEEGIIDVYYIENLIIYGTDKTLELQMVPIGVTEENLFEGKAYEMILNEEVF